ncbi:SDR family oxidoreductase [Streptomyces aureus]|uniref:SDR family oxidoreductase n=2 Tax=Streptomyces TaxID=1883 RepID=A0ABV4SXI5_9ACTN
MQQSELNALVTGGGSGIGLDIARTLLAGGATVTIAGRSERRLEEARKLLVDEGAAPGRLHRVRADASVEDECAAAVAAATAVTGKLTAVVACAGEPRGQMSPVTELDLDQWQSAFQNNVVATMLTLKYGARELVRAGGGAFVSISSISALLSARFAAPISSAKAAIEQLCRIAAVELAPSDVTVNVVRPGLVEVPRQNLPPEIRQNFLDIIPMGRLGGPHDIAGAIEFLVGPNARWLTGQVISVDGGQTLNRAFDATPWVEPTFGPDRMRGLVP